MVNINKLLLGAAALTLSFSVSAHAADKILIGLVTKTDGNPFYAKMKEGAQAKAKELGVELQSYAGKIDGDSDSQIAAIESLISAGAKGLMITPSDPKGIVPTLEKARKAGMFIVALDTETDPINAADATFETDNKLAGELIGKWAAATLGDKAKDAKIAFLDAVENQPTVDWQRDIGFQQGFGIKVKNPTHYGDEDDPRVVGHQWGQGAEDGGRTGMEQLLQREPGINVVYTINEPTAAGAYEALKAVKREKDTLLVSVDGGCPGVKNVAAGVIGATSQQYPLKMAEMGVEAIVNYVKTGAKPKNSEGLNFFNTGVKLVTDKPVPGIDSITSKEALKLCWG